MHNALRTLVQLVEGGGLRHAELRDWPAFAWRGFMVDVGRNYMSVARLKRTIDVMAAYKLNVFHLQVRRHPELTDALTMTRWKGLSYSQAEVRELIRYCRERHVRFVLEVDMPGHSAAFRRATGHDMQSDTGMAILKDVMAELLDTYDTEYIHIGADEVRIVNPRFVPEMTRFIRARGRRVIGWQPGGNYDDTTIRQLWRESPGRNSIDFEGPYLDSRHLYLNHHDPLESVVTVFHRRLAGRLQGDDRALGAILCLWNDRAVAEEADLWRMNPVFPALLAFSERSWRGGGREGWIANLPDDDSLGFRAFEDRLIRHRDRHFRDVPFPYVRQTGMRWDLYGPYDRVSDSLRPAVDVTRPATAGLRPFRSVTGGTVVLRHWWAPLVEGAVAAPADHTTVYAYTRFWSDAARAGRFWIGFNDLSRSYATDPPPVGAWDTKGSAAWLNGVPVPPPAWARAGGRGHPEVPLVDEGYSYRTPTVLPVRKGWNHVWLRLPARAFRVRDSGNPEKWMFTFVEVE
jgi:inhibitor of KinA sporulation pathway (predicted exonuclease)